MKGPLGALAILLLAAGCAGTAPPRPPAAAVAPPPTAAAPVLEPLVCRGGESVDVVSDRGIGGTGTMADRGIGGTGTPAGTAPAPSATMLRGLPTEPTDVERGTPGGSAGIVGVLTGFDSLCVDGVEVAIDRPVHVTVDGGEPAEPTLRVGEVAAIVAGGSPAHLRALRIDIRHEVSGQVTAAAGDAIEVAGQHVLLTAETRLGIAPGVGAWVAVSGLRDGTGSIRATRVDPRPPGATLVAGVPEPGASGWRIGALALQFAADQQPSGGRVVATGELTDGTLRVQELSDEPLVPSMRSLRWLLVEGYPNVAGREVRMPAGLEAGVGPRFGPAPPGNQPEVLELAREPGVGLVAVSWRPAPSPGGGSGSGRPPSANPAAPTSLLQAPPAATAASVPPAAAASATAATAASATTAATAASATTAATAGAQAMTSGGTSTAAGAAASAAAPGAPSGAPPGATSAPPAHAAPASAANAQGMPATVTVSTAGKQHPANSNGHHAAHGSPC